MRFNHHIYRTMALGTVYLTSMGVCECGQKACRTQSQNTYKPAFTCKYSKEHNLKDLAQNAQTLIFKKNAFHDDDFTIQLETSSFSISGSLIESKKSDETYSRLKIEEAATLSVNLKPK